MIDLDGIDLNGYEDGTSSFSIDPESGFPIGAGPLEYQWVERRFGAVPLPDPKVGVIELDIPLVCIGDDDDDILAQVGTLAQKAEKIRHTTGGVEIGWRKLGATYESTLTCLAVEIGSVTISINDQRMRVGRFTVKLTCSPFILAPERTVASGRKPAGVPSLDLTIDDVEGDVLGPAWVEVLNQSTVPQQFFLGGFQHRDAVAGNEMLLPASTLDVSTAPLNGTYTAGTNEVQTLTKSGTLSGGTYTLTFEGQTTTALANTANAATIQAALEALSTVGAGDWVVTGGPISAANVVFTAGANLAARNVSAISITSSLTGGGTATMSTTTPGVEGYVSTSLYSEYSAFCRTADQTDEGSYQLWARVYDAGSVANSVRVRAAWSVGDTASAKTNRAVSVPACGAPIWVSLGESHITPGTAGTHRWNVTVEACTLGTVGTSFRVLDIQKVPIQHGRAAVKSPIAGSARTIAAVDNFSVVSGALNGDSSSSGHTWTSGGDADDFNGTGSSITRTAVSDSAGVGRYAYIGSSVSDCQVSASVENGGGTNSRTGVIARFDTATGNCIGAFYRGTGTGEFLVSKRISGTWTDLIDVPSAAPIVTGACDIEIVVRSDGSWSATFYDGTYEPTTWTGYDAALVTGGSLASGRRGVYDERQIGSAQTREITDFESLSLPAPEAAIHPSQSLEWGYDGSLQREASGGTYYAMAAGQRRSGLPMLGPAGDEGLANRLVLATADQNPDYAATTNAAAAFDYVVKHRPAFQFGRHVA